MEREPRPDKVAVVDEVRDRFAEAEAVLLTDYRGLDVTEMADVRTALLEAGAQMKVYKNTLVRLATENSPEGLADLLSGPVALTFTGEDPSPAAKALRDFAKDHEALVIKGGVMAGRLLTPEEVATLATLPSRDVVLAQIAGGLAAPLSQLLTMVNSLVAETAGLLNALIDKTPSEPAPAPEPAAEADAPTEAAAPEAEATDEAPAEVDEASDVEASADAEAPADEPSDDSADQAEDSPAEDSPTEATDNPEEGDK